MKSWFFRKNKPESGQSLIELALVLLILIILVSGIVDLGRVLFYYVTLRDAAQEGVVYGSIYPHECDTIEARAKGPLTRGGADGVEISIKMGLEVSTAGALATCAAVLSAAGCCGAGVAGAPARRVPVGTASVGAVAAATGAACSGAANACARFVNE